ncbi:MAG: DUF6049 family protein [Nocardioidaceae bacterium]
MTWTSPGRAAACLVTVVLLVLAGLLVEVPAGAAATGSDGSGDPLQVSIDTLSPSTVPAHGRVTISGRITNTSHDTWTDLQVYMLRSTSPLTSSADLAAAADSDPASEVGTRLAGAGLYQDIGDLAPGESTPYLLSVPRRELGLDGTPGVYWFGVHVLGALDGMRDAVADGRARTFLPLLPARVPTTRLALVVPLRAPVRRDAQGQLVDLRAWQRTLAHDGRLSRLLTLGNQAGGRAVTWLVDPAVVDAVRSVAGQNPPLDLAPTTGEPSQESSGPTPSSGTSPSPSAPASGSPGTGGGGASPGGPTGAASGTSGADDQPSPSSPGTDTTGVAGAGALEAASWIQGFQRLAASQSVMTVPYGDLDVAAALRHHGNAVLRAGRQLSARTMAELNVSATPVVAPVDGYLPAQALARVHTGRAVLLRDSAFPHADRPVLTTDRGADVVLTDSEAGTGGPDPATRWSALAVRQRLLSEAALHALSPDHARPLVVSTPQGWNPGPDVASADFFGGLDASWLQLVSVPNVVATASPGTTGDGPVYPRRHRRREVPAANLRASHRLIGTGDVFARLLTRNDTVDEQLAQLALLGSGALARREPVRARERTRSTIAHVHQLMRQVQVEGPPFVTMSSERGPIQITVVNGLDQEVTVAVRALTGSRDLTIDAPDPVTLGPGRRASLRLTAAAKDIGVHRVLLEATDADGHPLGSVSVFTVRTSQVGLVIWLVMAAGGVVLLAAIALRVLRRVRRRRATHGPLLPRESGKPREPREH